MKSTWMLTVTDHQHIAKRLVQNACLFGVKKIRMGEAHRYLIRSVQTALDYQDCVCNFLRFRAEGRVPSEGPYLRAEADEFLFLSSLTWQQKTLDQHRQALDKVFCLQLPRYKAGVPTRISSRAYTKEEVDLVLAQMSARHALSVRLIAATGMRASELLSLTDFEKQRPSPERPWLEHLFAGLANFVVCTVRGKGGLVRQVAVPEALHEQINALRYSHPVSVRDRRKSHSPTFDLVAGQALSQAFSRASKKALNFSFGIHGLRHAYVQRRLGDLQEYGFTLVESLNLCAQEVGHFRTEITTHYMTPRD